MKEVGSLIIFNICKFFRYLGTSIKSIVVRVKDRMIINVKNTDDYGYVDLGPTDDADNSSEYLRALDWAINNKNVTNIALAGPFGAGKSSIIRTFLKSHPSIKSINISLATFRENSQEKMERNSEEFERKLEEGILKQLFYKVDYLMIPQSRYRKLHKVSFVSNFMRVTCTIVLIFSCAFLFAPLKIKELSQIYSDTMLDMFGWSVFYQVIVACGFGLIIIFIVTIFFRWVNTKWKSIEINIADKAIIKTEEVSDVLSLNKTMDEILYFFEETKYTFVVFEDLDRFDTPEIYTKLREINKIINDYDAIKRKINFVYALKDDIFYNADRVKFFDFIIPIVPYIDATNSNEYLKRRLKNLQTIDLKIDISAEYIMNVAPFISDMRVLNNICNEFIVFKKTIKESQDLKKLQDIQMFSIIMFKNIYPEEFTKIQESEGIIKKAYSKKADFIKLATDELQSEIQKAEEEKKRADSSEILCAEDVKLAFIQKIMSDRGIFKSIQRNEKTFTKNEILQKDFSLSQIGVGTIRVDYQESSYSYSSFQIDEIEKIKCSDGISYYEKCDRAIARDKEHYQQITQNLLIKQKKLYEFRAKSMKSLIKEYGAKEVLGEELVNNKLLVFLLRHGYIDDTYQMYINYFLPGNITSDELNFILDVRNYEGKIDWNYKIMHPKNVLNHLFDYELEQQKECLNFDLADFFYADNTVTKKKTSFTKQLAKEDEDSRKFIKEYYVRARNKEEYIQNIAKQKPLFWFDICSDKDLGYQDKVTYLKDIFMYLKIEDIVLQDMAASKKDSVYSIGTFITASDEVLEQLQGAGSVKIAAVLPQINAKFRNININSVNTDIIEAIYEHELFEISLDMLQKYADFRMGHQDLAFKLHIYTFILNQKDNQVIKYLERNIGEFVTDVILPTETNTRESVGAVYRCIKLLNYDENLSIQLIQKMDITMENLQEWINSIENQHKDVRKIVDTFILENKMKASVANLDTYKAYYAFSPELCVFVDKNIDRLLLDPKMDDTHVNMLLKQNIKDKTIDFTLSIYKMKTVDEKLSSYQKNVIQLMIKLRYFKYSRNKYNEIVSSFPELLPLFVEYYWDEFEAEMPSINFEVSVVDELMKSEIDDEKKCVFLNEVDASYLTDVMVDFIRNTDVNISKEYLKVTWQKIEVNERAAFLVKYFSKFNIKEIQDMFEQMPEEYHALKQENNRHKALLKNNVINKSLCEKLVKEGYLSSYTTKKEKNVLFTGDVEIIVARVKAKKQLGTLQEEKEV